jgi:hypothetical protein
MSIKKGLVVGFKPSSRQQQKIKRDNTGDSLRFIVVIVLVVLKLFFIGSLTIINIS